MTREQAEKNVDMLLHSKHASLSGVSRGLLVLEFMNADPSDKQGFVDRFNRVFRVCLAAEQAA